MLRAIGAALKQARLNRGLSIPRLATLSGLFDWQIRDIESGESDTSIGEVCRVCESLGGYLVVTAPVQKNERREMRTERQKLKRRMAGEKTRLILETVESHGKDGVGAVMMACGLTKPHTAEYNRLRRIGLIHADGKVVLTDAGRSELDLIREHRRDNRGQ